jgi:hypothetical protein
MAAVESTTGRVRRRTVLTAAIGLIAAANGTTTWATAAWTTAAWAGPDPAELAVVDRETGQPLRIWRHRGRLFIAGELGDRYSLRVTNHTDARILVVVSVDGVNVMTGETAGYDQRGYVFDPHQSYDIVGWRKSDTEVADFTFAPLPQSYAAKTGRPGDVGVIGMAVFKEKVAVPTAAAVNAPPPPPPPPSVAAPAPALPLPPVRFRQPESIAPPAPPPPPPPAPPAARVAGIEALSAQPAPLTRSDEKLGTAHGARERSVIYTVNFERATPYPQAVQQIEYDTFDRLVARGVIPSHAERPPRPFPAKPGSQGFVPDPPDAP